MATKAVIFSSCSILNVSEPNLNNPHFPYKFLASDYQMVIQLIIISSCLEWLFSSKMPPCISDNLVITLTMECSEIWYAKFASSYKDQKRVSVLSPHVETLMSLFFFRLNRNLCFSFHLCSLQVACQ